MQQRYSWVAGFSTFFAVICFLPLFARADSIFDIYFKYFCAFCHAFLWSTAFVCWRMSKREAQNRIGKSVLIGGLIIFLGASLISIESVLSENSRNMTPEELMMLNNHLNTPTSSSK